MERDVLRLKYVSGHAVKALPFDQVRIKPIMAVAAKTMTTQTISDHQFRNKLPLSIGAGAGLSPLSSSGLQEVLSAISVLGRPRR